MLSNPYIHYVISLVDAEMIKGGHLYIITNRHRNVLYIGVTSDLPRRIYEHRHHLLKGSFSDRYNLEHLIYYEFFNDIESAIAREKQLKKWSRAKKEMLINLRNPEWQDLYDEVIGGIFSL